MIPLSSVLLFAFAPAPALPATPTGAVPRIQFVTVKDDTLVSSSLINETVSVPVREKVIVNGQVVEVTRLIPQTVTKQVMQSIDLKTAAIFDLAGKVVEKDEAIKRLKNGGVIVVSTDGNKVDPLYLKAFKEDTLVIVPKPPKQGGSSVDPVPPTKN